MNNEKFYLIKEIAKTYRVTPEAVLKWIKEGKLKAIRIGGVWRIPESALQEFIKASMEERKEK
ncbi:MAG: helix-turn-helix domain-containing protein [Candidatus Bathyarchaeia archaeon]